MWRSTLGVVGDLLSSGKLDTTASGWRELGSAARVLWSILSLSFDVIAQPVFGDVLSIVLRTYLSTQYSVAGTRYSVPGTVGSVADDRCSCYVVWL